MIKPVENEQTPVIEAPQEQAHDDPKGSWIAERDQLVASLNETRQAVQQQTILCHRLEGAISILNKFIGPEATNA